MDIETIANILIYYLHAPLGGLALLAGAIALIVKKGSHRHKQSGKIFYYTMLISAITALIIAVLPQHESPFLFSIGVFSIYFLISGFRALNFKQKELDLRTDRIVAYAIIATGIIMMLYPILLYGRFNIILLVFGFVGMVFGLRDLKLFKDVKKLQKNWLKLHLGKMTGGYIAAVSAFFVVNQVLPGIWNWFVPTIIGTGYIIYWIRKFNKKERTKS